MKTTLKTVSAYLKNIQNRGHLNGLVIVNSDARQGKLIALGEVTEHGSITSTSTDYLTTDEMYRFLQGYDRAKLNIL